MSSRSANGSCLVMQKDLKGPVNPIYGGFLSVGGTSKSSQIGYSQVEKHGLRCKYFRNPPCTWGYSVQNRAIIIPYRRNHPYVIPYDPVGYYQQLSARQLQMRNSCSVFWNVLESEYENRTQMDKTFVRNANAFKCPSNASAPINPLRWPKYPK